MSIYGYTRISRAKQNIDRQIRNIKAEYPTAIIVQEVYTRTSFNRKEWQKLINKVKNGDTVVFDSVSRMSGNAEDGFSAYEKLFSRGVELVFLKEPHINTATYKKALENNVELTGTSVDYILEGVNRYLMALAKEQIFLAFEQSEKEIMDLHQRTKEGIETARLNGKQIGGIKGAKLHIKKAAPIMRLIEKKSKDFDGYNNDVEVMGILAVEKVSWIDSSGKTVEMTAKLSRNTYYKYKKIIMDKRLGKN